jgi:light-regulated signal transduction histidine kinase (bacteriophytochrome)
VIFAKRKQLKKKIRNINIELENRVHERTTQLQNAYDEMEAFTYSVSHDLRSPLRATDGFSQALLEDYADQLDDTAKDVTSQ